MRKLTFILTCGSIINCAYATESNTSLSTESGQIVNQTESNITITAEELKILKKLAEQAKLNNYSGVPGTAPKDKTVSATGAALEETQSGPQIYAFFTQTLANGFYYEGRLYAKYNMLTQNPAFPNIQPSEENNPPGYKGVVKLGYNFHVTDDYDITPYLRLEAGNNMSIVYADNNGNYVNSTNYALLPGFKQTFKLSPKLNPYIDIYGGLVQVNLTGNLTQGPNPNQQFTGSVLQYQLTTEFGLAYKFTEHQAIIPYTQFVYTANNPNSSAAAPYNQGGFNVSQLTTSQQVYAIKYSYSW